MSGALRRFWAARDRRERVILAAGGVLLAVALLYVYAWQPVVRERTRLEASLPTLRVQLQEMRAGAQEAEALKRVPKLATLSIDAAMRQAGTEAALSATAAQTAIIDAAHTRVTMQAVSFEQWLRWITALQAHYRVRVESCRIEALPQPGAVRVEATLVGG